MNQLTPYGQDVLRRYRVAVPCFITIRIPFDVYNTANAVTNTISANEVTDDFLGLEMTVDFTNASVRGIVKDNTGYSWMESEIPAPVHSFAGAADQVNPILPFPIEVFIPNNSKMQFQFTNAPSSQETTARYLTCRGLRLKDRITE